MGVRHSVQHDHMRKDYYVWSRWTIVISVQNSGRKSLIKAQHRFIPSRKKLPNHVMDGLNRWCEDQYCNMDLDEWLTKLFDKI